MHRTLFLAPVAFVILTLLGFPSFVGGLFAGGSSATLTGKPIPNAAPLATPSPTSGQLRAFDPTASATLTAADPPASPTTAPSPRIQPTFPATATLTIVPTLTVIPATPTMTLPTVTSGPTLTPILNVALPPRKVGNDRAPQVSARQIVVVDGDSGEILYEQEAHRRSAPASTTKIVTALVALASKDPSD